MSDIKFEDIAEIMEWDEEFVEDMGEKAFEYTIDSS